MKSPRERLLAAHAALRNAAAGNADTTDAHFAAFEAYADLGMMTEARDELDQARASLQSADLPRRRVLAAHDEVLALLEGDYARAVSLRDTGGSVGDYGEEWLPHFLRQRELGFDDADEADLRARAAREPSARADLALVLLLLDRGRSDEAGTLPRSGDEALFDVAMAAEAASLLGDASAADVSYGRLLPFAGRPAIAHRLGSLGAVDRYLGLGAATLERLDHAVLHVESAIRVNERMGARPWQAHAQADLATLLERRRADSDATRAAELRAEAQRIASALGMTVLLAALGQAARSSIGQRPAATEAVGSAPPGRAAGEPAGNLFRRDGEYWTVRYDGVSFTLRDTKGVQYLARLLAAPGVEFHVLDLASDGAPAGRAVNARTTGVSAADLGTDGLGDAGDILDAKAREEYRTRIRDLGTDLAEAEAWNDPERVAHLQAEREFLVHEISAAVGLGGRSRAAVSASERARLNVGKTIRSAIDRIETHNPALARHLTLAVHTGTFCSYVPDPALKIVWTV
jgi:tetratricopeptide (TPR) repeat protein